MQSKNGQIQGMRLRFKFIAATIVVILAIRIGPVGAMQAKNDSASRESMNVGSYVLRDRLTDIFFLTPSQGWAVGGRGLILLTTNGGKTWINRKISDDDLLKVKFKDPNVGWIRTATGFIWTQDGGRSWVRWSSPTTNAANIYFVSSKAGWLIGRNGLITRTEDGGRSWKNQASRTTEFLVDIACVSDRECIIVGWNGTLLTTSDAGETWLKREVPIPEFNRERNLDRIQVSYDGTVWIMGGMRRETFLLRSEDKGRSWMIANDALPFPLPSSMFFWNRAEGVVVGNSLEITNDAGATWSPAVAPMHPLLVAVYFADKRNGWVVGDHQTILHTNDGGKNWSYQYKERLK